MERFSGFCAGNKQWGKFTGKYGGVCPTHFDWRASCLKLLKSWLDDYTDMNGISGVWLDFIGCPGRWEHEDPSIPDTCYCQRVLTLFQAEKGVQLLLIGTIPLSINTLEKVSGSSEYAD